MFGKPNINSMIKAQDTESVKPCNEIKPNSKKKKKYSELNDQREKNTKET